MRCFKERYLLHFLKPTACLPYYYNSKQKSGCFPAYWRLMECSPCSLHMVSPSAPSSLSNSLLWRGFLYLLKDLQLSTGRKKIGLRQHEWSLMKVWREITVGRTFSLEWHSVAFWQAGDCRINPPALPGSPTSSCIWLTSKFKRKNKHFLDSPLKINDSISCC